MTGAFMKHFAWLTLCLAILSGCATTGDPVSSNEAIRASAYRAPEAPEITIFTMVNNRSGSGGHSAMLVSGSERVIFDPAGSFKHSTVPERGDVLYGVSPSVELGYKSAHARDTYHVVSQKFVVTPAQAEIALQLVENNGSVPGSFCTNATSSILRQVPGFEDVGVTFFPINLMNQLAGKPGVKTDKYYENDAGDVSDGAVALTF
jgi:hypothetical protein